MSFLDDIVNLAANNTTNATTSNTTSQLMHITWESFNVFLYFGAFMILCILILIYVFIKVKESTEQPGDLFLMIAICSLIQNIHYFSTALGSPYLNLNGGKIFDSDSLFCRINAISSVLTSSLLYWYNISFLYYTCKLIDNIFKGKTIP